MKSRHELTVQIEKEAAAVAQFHAKAQQRLNEMQAELVRYQAEAESEIQRRNGRIELLNEMVAEADLAEAEARAGVIDG